MNQPAVGDRGFRAFAPIVTRHGDTVAVRESSAADGPHIWLTATDGSHIWLTATAHLSLAAASQLRDQLTWLIENHYQVADRNPLDLCAACNGSGRSLRNGDTCRACTGEIRGPRRWRMGDVAPPVDVICVADYTAEGQAQDDEDGWTWGRVSAPAPNGEAVWKGYKNGGKVYLDWYELVRRWGPVAEVPR